jgi:REP element-mobilizing transposase RayT
MGRGHPVRMYRMQNLSALKGWHSRGYLPHFDAGSIPQAVTFRLAGSLPWQRLRQWREELNNLKTAVDEEQYRARIEHYLDLGHGPNWLRMPEVASLVEGSLLHFDRERYRLHAWVVMPNHVHVLLTPAEAVSLSAIVHSWKSFSGVQANRLLARSGPFWQTDYFDHYVRNQIHFNATIEYIQQNPVKAGLCCHPGEWPFGNARFCVRDE